MVTEKQEKNSKIVLDCAFEVHSQLGPGLLEKVYQTCLCFELQRAGLYVEMEKQLPVSYKGISMDCGYRIDLLVERDQLIVECKSVQTLNDIHVAQILNYMRISGISLGLLLNFNVRHLKEGMKIPRKQRGIFVREEKVLRTFFILYWGSAPRHHWRGN
jgi:GxxExxY protein